MGFSLKDVVEKMGKEADNSTLGWDVVVNYGESEINKLLRDLYSDDSHGHLKEFSVVVIEKDIDLNEFTVTFNLQLGAPLISFVGTGVRPFCSLTIPVGGGTTKTSTKTLDIPSGGYEIVLKNLELASTTGSSTSTPLIPSDQPFVFPTQGAQPAYVTIDIHASPDVAVQVNTLDANKTNAQIEARKTNLQGAIVDYFKDGNKKIASSIQYQLATIDPAPPPDGYVVLKPLSFRFAAYQSSAHPKSILSVFIQTSSTSAGEKDDLQATWTSKWVVEYKVPPIPDRYTASIIFRSSMMHETMVAAALKAKGMSADAPKFEKGQGLSYKIKTGIVVQRDAITGNPSTTAIRVDLNDDDKTLHLLLGQQGNNDSSPTGSVTWAYKYEFDWKYTWEGTTISGAPYDCEDDEHVTIKNNLAKTSSFSGSLTDRSLKLALNIAASDWDPPKVTMKSTTWWSKIFGSDEKDGSGWAKDLLATPSLTLDMGDLDFFMTTNILMPGDKFIKVDVSTGLRIPHDYYVVGTLYEPITPQLPEVITFDKSFQGVASDGKHHKLTLTCTFWLGRTVNTRAGLRSGRQLRNVTIPIEGESTRLSNEDNGTSKSLEVSRGAYEIVLENLWMDGSASDRFKVRLNNVDKDKSNDDIEDYFGFVLGGLWDYFKGLLHVQ